MNDVNVLLFGMAREIVSASEIRLPAPPGTTTASILDALVERHPALGQWKPFLRVALNREYAPPERVVSPGDEVAVIPPVSGG